MCPITFTPQAEELEARLNGEMAKRFEHTKDLETMKEELHEVKSEVEERRRKLTSVQELKLKLSEKVRASSLSKSRIEVILENAVRKREEVIREIEVLRRQRDVIQSRVEFCREKDALGEATTNRLTELSFNYMEFTPEEIRAATEDFSQHLRLKSACHRTNVYRGHTKATTIAVKCMVQLWMDEEAFQTKVHWTLMLALVYHASLFCQIIDSG